MIDSCQTLHRSSPGPPKNVDLKLQYERVRIDSSITPASFVNPQPGLQVGDRAHVFSATLDFVW